MTSLHLAVDGGNSKTVAIVCDGNGTVLGAGASGCGDIYGARSPEFAVAAVMEAVRAALLRSGANQHDVVSSVFSLAGVDWPEDEIYWRKILAEQLPGLMRLSLRNDGFAPLRCGNPRDGLGLAIVVGTGAAVAARASDDRCWALSFWLRDPFGGLALGEAAFRAVCKSELGLAPESALKRALLEHFQASGVEALLHAFTRLEGRRPGGELAQLAPAVLTAARDGDAVAQAIIKEQADNLASYAAACARAVGYHVEEEVFPVTLAGSILMAPKSAFTHELLTALACRIPTARPALSALPPIAGVALDAIVEAGNRVDHSVMDRLEQTLPDWRANFSAVRA